MSNIFQTPEWAKFKCQTGYEKYYEIDGVFVLQKKLPLNRTMLYSPMVDGSQWSVASGQEFMNTIKEIGKQNKTIFYRAEFDVAFDPDQQYNNTTIQQSGFIKSFEEMQPEHTLILNITKSDEDILAQMKPKGRYNIKIAEKHGVVVKKSRTVSDFYKLYEQTAKRQKITYRGIEYFQKLLDNLEPKGYSELFTASDENGTILASAIISFYNHRATYLFGASSDESRNVMAPYGLHWQIIAEAKRRGCTEYDFFGIAPDENPKHPWAGVTSFKKKFGGEEVHLLGSWDLVMRPAEYQIFKLAEKIRRH